MSVYVTDTHPLIWFVGGEQRKLSSTTLRVFRQCKAGKTMIYVPVPVLWELSLLARVGRIDLEKPIDRWCQELFRRPTFAPVPLDIQHVVEAHNLRFTTDPFDLLIVAVARTLGYPLITKDTAIEEANLLPTFW
jgi:PIN domain nuclease of toxin-antitoxin system